MLHLSYVSIHLLVSWVFLVFMFLAVFFFFSMSLLFKSDLQFDEIVYFKRKQLTAKFSKAGKCQAKFFHALNQIRQTFISFYSQIIFFLLNLLLLFSVRLFG